MQLSITMADEQEAGELQSLYSWLAEDDNVTQGVKITLGASEDEPGTMGPDVGTVTAIIEAGTSMVSAMAAVISVIVAWQQTRPRGRGKVVASPDNGNEPISLGSGDDPAQPTPLQLSAQILGTDGQASAE